VFRDRLARGIPAPVLHRSDPAPKRIGNEPVTVTLHVCTTCRRGLPDAGDEAVRAGSALYAALVAAGAPDGVRILPVECLSACDNGCSVALSGQGRWSYVYGHMDADNHVTDILSGAAAYARAPDGIVPWRERPVIFRKQSLARIPPMESLE
jgi:predicted metal-binding protein